MGDALYAPAPVRALSPRLMLHAQSLSFVHPFTDQAMAFSQPIEWSAEAPYGVFNEVPKMNFETFQQQALDEGFDEVLERTWEPNTVLETHTHPFAVKARVTAGQLWLSCTGVDGTPQKRYLTPGDEFSLAAGEPHAEQYGPEGASYWVARKN
jgi:hypothetical protein